MNHHIVKCKGCEKVIAQCRCPAVDKTVRYETCEECKKGERGNDVCVCLHARKLHGKSYSINYTDGHCTTCNCKNFMMD